MSWDIDSFLALLEAQAANPIAMFVLIIIATFILEDPATVAAAFIAAEGLLDPVIALLALYVGIFVGDLGLYGLGRLATKYWRVRKFLERKGMVTTANWLEGWMVPAILGARFAPGMRLPTYTACGLFKLSFFKFSMTTFIAVFFFTTALFVASYMLGNYILQELGNLRWVIGAGVVVAVVFLPRLLKRFSPKKFEKMQNSAQEVGEAH